MLTRDVSQLDCRSIYIFEDFLLYHSNDIFHVEPKYSLWSFITWFDLQWMHGLYVCGCGVWTHFFFYFFCRQYCLFYWWWEVVLVYVFISFDSLVLSKKKYSFFLIYVPVFLIFATIPRWLRVMVLLATRFICLIVYIYQPSLGCRLYRQKPIHTFYCY